MAQQQDVLGGHAGVDKQTQDQSAQHSTHPDTHLQTGRRLQDLIEEDRVRTNANLSFQQLNYKPPRLKYYITVFLKTITMNTRFNKIMRSVKTIPVFHNKKSLVIVVVVIVLSVII